MIRVCSVCGLDLDDGGIWTIAELSQFASKHGYRVSHGLCSRHEADELLAIDRRHDERVRCEELQAHERREETR